MTLAVGDANLLASGFVRRKSDTAPVQFLDAWRTGRFTLVVSEHILGELQRTLASPYFLRYLSRHEVDGFAVLLRTDAMLVLDTVNVSGVATHPEDDLVLAAAVTAKAEYLVTGDVRFATRVAAYQGVTLVSPREFITILNA